MSSQSELRLEVENLDLRRLLAQAGVAAAEKEGVERVQRLLLEEMTHRIKNTLASVIAITSQSLRVAKSLEDGRQAITHRLLALGRVHDILLQANWVSTPVTVVVTRAIEPFNDGRFVVNAAEIDVCAKAVLPLAMALNELCTNAVKYGALSNDTGTVTITATVHDAGSKFRLQWVESGGPAVAMPTQRSFGSKLIEQSFARELNGEVQLNFPPSGVVCTLDIPRASLEP